MRPFVWVRYELSDAWMWRRGRTAAAGCGPLIENATSAPAYDIQLSDLTLDDETRYRFDGVDTLQPGEARSLDSLLQPRASLTQVISRHVVGRALAGQPPVSGWPMRIAYRSRRGREYETCCEIRITHLPLGIASVIVGKTGGRGGR
jgi:hypothetical protein